MASPAWLEATADGVRVYLRVGPRASRTAVQGVGEGPGPDGRARGVLKVAVTAVPEAGKANAAVIALLAGEWNLAKSQLKIVAGGADRSKTVFIAGDAAALSARLIGWAATLTPRPAAGSKPLRRE